MNRTHRITLSAVALLFFMSILSPLRLGADAQLDDLVRDLSGSDESARVEARQHLPACGTEAIPQLIPLVNSDNPAVAKAARDVLMDIANEVSTPGRDDDRRDAAELFISMIRRDRPEPVRVFGLKLLAITVPDGFDVKPISDMLTDRQYREAARVTLERIGSQEAAQVLRKALRDADPEFTCALLDSLGMLGDPESVSAIKRLTTHENEAICLAAAHALALIGDPGSERAITAVVETATDESRSAAVDSLLLFADTIVRKHRDEAAARKIYLKVLNTSENEALQCAALAGLGTVADLRTVPVILDLMDRADERAQVWSSAVAALKRIRSDEISSFLIREYPDRSAKTQLAIIEVLGARRDAASFPFLAEAARNTKPAIRLAALRALGDLGDVLGLDILIETTQKAAGEEKVVAVDAIARLADALKAQGKRNEAGQAYARVLELASEDSMRSRALQGLAICPVPEAAPNIISNADRAQSKDDSVAALGAVAALLEQAGRKDEALRAYEKLFSLGESLDRVHGILARTKARGANIDMARCLGFVTSWLLIGPFDDTDGKGWTTPYIGEPETDLAGTYVSGSSDLRWRHHVTPDETGKVNLISVLGQHEHVVAYACTEIAVSKDCEAVLKIGADDGVKCWVNGEQVWDKHVNRPLKVDEDAVKCALKAGVNRILLKISQNNMGWEFCVRVSSPEGAIIPFVQNAYPAAP